MTSSATDLPIHRPLLSMDETGISERAREIGTYADSTIPAGCNRFAPDLPEMNGSLGRRREVEPDDLPDRAQRDAEAAERIDVER